MSVAVSQHRNLVAGEWACAVMDCTRTKHLMATID
jgi:hypothetical protein